MVSKFDNGQLRGAYAAGFETGVRQGAERMRIEGWRRCQDGDVLTQGDIVKTLVPTLSGWIGRGRVLNASSTGVRIEKLDCPMEDVYPVRLRTAYLSMHEVARKVIEDL